MSVEFNEEQSFSRPSSFQKPPSGIIGFLLNKGIAKDTQQANYILIGTIGVLVIIFFISVSISSNSSKTPENSPALIDPVI